MIVRFVDIGGIVDRQLSLDERSLLKPVLVVEEAGVPGENHRLWASNW
jgi:hypothetical protein